jgi:hypothetical protein
MCTGNRSNNRIVKEQSADKSGFPIASTKQAMGKQPKNQARIYVNAQNRQHIASD